MRGMLGRGFQPRTWQPTSTRSSTKCAPSPGAWAEGPNALGNRIDLLCINLDVRRGLVRRDMGMGRRASDNRHACNHRRLGASTEARLAWPSSQVNPATFAGRAVRHILVSCRTEPRYARPHSLAKKETTARQVH
jgi:hypothetical protein